jgi:hemerythrin-like domain-containing protein
MRGSGDRRAFLTLAGAGALVAACRDSSRQVTLTSATDGLAPGPAGQRQKSDGDRGNEDGRRRRENDNDEKPEEVTATEDLMREHGVIRRVLVVYRESAARLRVKNEPVNAEALRTAARLMRSFCEDYHEKELEEGYLFPVLTKASGALAGTVSMLAAQHQRGREITDYVLSMTEKPIDPRRADALARTLEGLVRMYEEHTAIEDTVVFPAWKKVLSPKALSEVAERFEDIEHRTFGKDGFEDAAMRIAGVEKALGIDLSAMTPPPPPKG